jgi:probable rRNA maturation factor
MIVDVTLEGVDYDTQAVEAFGGRVLSALGLGEAELSIVLCDDAFIKPLNLAYRGIDAPTDVLSFAMQEGEDLLAHDPVLGDVIVSLETARRQADEVGHSLADELHVLLVHGVLHLLGFEHVHGGPDAEEMAAEEIRVLAASKQPG